VQTSSLGCMIEVDSSQQLYEVSSLGAAALLDYARDAELMGRIAERRKFRLASQWCREHEVGDRDKAAEWGEVENGSGDECDVRVGGAGTPMIASGCAVAFAAALSMTTQSGMNLLCHALDLEHRLPRLFAQVEALSLTVWKARRVAEATTALSVEAAAYVDEQLAGRAQGFGLVTLDRIVLAAIARFHPELVDDTEKEGKDTWDVTLDHGHPASFNGTSELTVTGDSVDLTRFYGTVSELAAALGKLGDPDPLPVRRSKAFAMMGDPDIWGAILDRAALIPDPTPADADSDAEPAGSELVPVPGDDQMPEPEATRDAEPSAGPSPASTGSSSIPRASLGWLSGMLRKPAKVKVYLHLSAADLIAMSTGTGEAPVIGEVEKLGPVTLDKIRQWLSTSGASITPVIDPVTAPVVNRVIDLNTTRALDAHDPPQWLRELVILRDGHCVFPWCATDARSCDLDHIDPYDDGPDGERAPPGQTSAANLAALCRRHHRAKTFDGWTYHRLPDSSYRWKDPYGNVYLVNKNGTHKLD